MIWVTLIALMLSKARCEDFEEIDILAYFVSSTLPWLFMSVSEDPAQLLPGLAAVFHRETLHDRMDGNRGLPATRPAIILDVGAYIGDVSSQVLQYFTDLGRHQFHGDAYGEYVPEQERRREILTLFGFEPNPATYRQLTARAQMQQWDRAGFCAVHAALSNNTAPSRLLLSASSSWGPESQLQQENEYFGPETLAMEPALEVNVTSLDSWMLTGVSRGSDHAVSLWGSCTRLVDFDFSSHSEIFLLKIDAQGHDDRILRGAERLLSAGLVRFIIFEYGGHRKRPDPSRRLRATVEFLWQFGFVCFFIVEKNIIPVSGRWWIDAYDTAGTIGTQHMDLFCAPVHDPGLPLLVELFVGNRHTRLAKAFVLRAIQSLQEEPRPRANRMGRRPKEQTVKQKHHEHLRKLGMGSKLIEWAIQQNATLPDVDPLAIQLVHSFRERGEVYALGYGAKPDLDNARLFYKLAGERGNIDAMLSLGILEHFHGNGSLLERRRLGLSLYEHACLHGHPVAFWMLHVFGAAQSMGWGPSAVDAW